MLRFRSRLLASVLVLAAMLAACDGDLTQPRDDARASFTILDGARGGNAQFFFLPPMVPAPTYSGTFDASQSPVVQICELAGNTCGATVASFSGSAVKVDLKAQAYSATWKTRGAGLDPTKLYRINVQVGTTVLGYADVVVLANGSQIKTVDKNQFVATINGGVLNIRFRIETAPPPPPPPGLWQNGDLVTYSQDSWGGDPVTSAAAYLLLHRFNVRYPAGIEVGLLLGAGFSLFFTSATAIMDFLPASGTYGALNSDVIDPTSSASGYFGGYVLALQLNVDFTDSGDIAGTSGLEFGDLRLCGLTATPAYNGLTVREYLAEMNSALGGGPIAYNYDTIAPLTNEVSLAFEAGVPSSFAQAHLVNGACSGGWQNGDMITYNQDNWGTPGTAAALLLGNFFDFVHPGGVEIGLSGNAGFSAVFTSADAVLAYQPAPGPTGVFDNDLIDPISTSAGIFGGYVLAVQLDVDFGDAHHLDGAAKLLFGDLRVCRLTATPGLNGLTVRQVLGALHQALGGGATPYSIDDLSQLAFDLAQSFESGIPSLFAQQQLVNGACP